MRRHQKVTKNKFISLRVRTIRRGVIKNYHVSSKVLLGTVGI